MTHDVNQPDIPDRELLAGGARPNVWTEIGEAKVTHTLFGRAKVRIIRKHDNTHRILWLTGIAAIVVAAAVWQGLLSRHPDGPVQSEDLPPPARAKEKVSPPAFQSENIASPAIPPAARKEPDTQAQVEFDKPLVVTKSGSEPVKDMQKNEPQTAKPVAVQPKPHMLQRKPVVVQPVKPQPLADGKLQAAQPAASNQTSNPVEAHPSARLLPPKQIAAPVTATSSVVPAQPASSPVDIIQLTAPLGRHGTPISAPAATDQGSAPVDVQSK
ncbi:hypothetical protein GALL_160430 [mine drainage metagenome]|uniref:Uncharacterized protein n=1 Tax=mine drainage metagenome TaxID=410659 RepID=A0A1J5SJR2_9ZZZZ